MAVTLRKDAVLQPIVRMVADDRGHPLERRDVDLQEERLTVARLLDGWPKEVLALARA